MRRRMRLCLLLLLMLSLPLLGGALPLAAVEPIDGLLRDLLPEDPGPIPAVMSISVGGGHTCAVTVAHDAYCWGYNGYGQLGDGTTTNRSTPVKVQAGAGLLSGTVATVSASYEHTCATTTTGDAFCWGSNNFGQLGDGTTTNSHTAVQVSAGGGLAPGTVASITTGFWHTCVATVAGDAYCWGRNAYGELGNGTTSNSPTPVKVSAGAGLAPGTTAAVDAGGMHTCAATSTGEALCWGHNSSGELGNGSTINSTTPVKVSSSTGLTSGTVATISGGTSHTCATTNAANAYCWGWNAYGQLGNGSLSTSTTPVPVAGGGLSAGTIATISAGRYHTCATASSGVYCWGQNSFGQLGNGSTTNSSTPVNVSNSTGSTPGATTVISAFERHSCSTTGGEAYCWGYNGDGRLGDGSTTSSSTPVKVAMSPYVPPKHCEDDSTRVDRVDWSNGANEFSVDVHEKPDGVYTCVYAERNGEVLVDEVIRVRGDLITVEEDAPPGNGPDSPCTVDHGEGGTSANRAYVRSTPDDAYPAAVCAGIVTSGGNRHVRVTIG